MINHDLRIVSYDMFSRALHNAIFWQNRVCSMEEMVELFCLDIEDATAEMEKLRKERDTAENSAKYYHDLFHFTVEDKDKTIAELKAKLKALEK